MSVAQLLCMGMKKIFVLGAIQIKSQCCTVIRKQLSFIKWPTGFHLHANQTKSTFLQT